MTMPKLSHFVLELCSGLGMRGGGGGGGGACPSPNFLKGPPNFHGSGDLFPKLAMHGRR